ncbi:MAG TPA: glycosyltransferase [Dermatophilaceae bacterium]|nr:glycosyltransferase [Dermatophilaceae bacterium]
MTPLVSVVVPFYNVERYLEACLRSIQAQTLRGIEVVLVDDGSPDGSLDIARAVAQTDDRLQIVRQSNAGLGPARNTGARHARGRYLTFVDSDDLLPPRALETLVRTLERTGSSFAAGNARRFSAAGGVRPSWSHARTFGRQRLATHIVEYPALVTDRMVWNKVYRRDFWDQHGYTFPAIWYEDYPVTLQAHLDAVTVDVLSTPTYFWRERESGDSITQQVFDVANLRDRATSAAMVLDVVEDSTRAVRSGAHTYLAEIDLVAFFQAFGVTSDPDEITEVLGTARELVRRLDPLAIGSRPRVDRIQHAALLAGDVSLLRELARFRDAGGAQVGAARRRAAPPWCVEVDYPGLGSASVPRRLYRVTPDSVRLVSSVLGVNRTEDGFAVDATAYVRHVATSTSTQVSVAVQGRRRSVPVPVRDCRVLHEDARADRLRFTVEVSEEVLRHTPGNAWPLRFVVSMRSGRTRVQGVLRGRVEGSATWPPGMMMGDVWVQPTASPDGVLVVSRHTRPAHATAIRVRDGVFDVSLRVSAGIEEASLVLERPGAGREVVAPARLRHDVGGTQARASLPAVAALSRDLPDDPYTERSAHRLLLAHSGGRWPVLWPERFRAIRAPAAGGVVSVTANNQSYLEVVRERPRTYLEEVGRQDGRLLLRGTDWTGDGDARLVWRHFPPDEGPPLDVPVPSRTCAERGWEADLDPEPAVEAIQRLGRVAGIPFVLFMTPAEGKADAVSCAAQAASAMPVEVPTPRGVLRLWPARGTVHLEVH